MRRFLAIVSLVACICSMQANVPLRYRLSGTAGTMMKGSIIDDWIGNRPILGGEIAVEFMPTGRWEGLQWYNNASVGLAFNYLNLTNDEVLGHAFAPYVYLNIPLVRLPHFIFGLRPGVGVSLVNKTYQNTVPADLLWQSSSIQYPVANGAIGSVTNAYFAEAIYMEFPIEKGWSITASYGWYHISNGSTKQPNSGYNMFNGAIGVTYFPTEDSYQAPEKKVPKGRYEGKRWDVEMSFSGGFRQTYYRDQQTVGVGSFSVAAHYRPWSIFKIGGGVDIFYDGYYRSICDEFAVPDSRLQPPITYFSKTYLASSNIANCFRIGVSLQPEFVLGNFSAGLHVGFYVVDPVKNLEPYAAVQENGGKPLDRGIFYRYDILQAGVVQDGWLYTRLMLKYRCTDNFFVQLGMKSHLMKAEFFDLGVGVCL